MIELYDSFGVPYLSILVASHTADDSDRFLTVFEIFCAEQLSVYLHILSVQRIFGEKQYLFHASSPPLYLARSRLDTLFPTVQPAAAVKVPTRTNSSAVSGL